MGSNVYKAQRMYSGYSAPAMPNITTACPTSWLEATNLTTLTSLVEDHPLPGNLPLYEERQIIKFFWNFNNFKLSGNLSDAQNI